VPAPQTPWALGPGIPAQDFKLVDLEGKPVQLSGLAGKTVLINFWATWCGLCVKEIPDLAELHRRRPDLVILGVAVDANPHDDDDEPKGTDGPEARIRRMASEKHINYSVLIDHDAQAMAAFKKNFAVSLEQIAERDAAGQSIEVWFQDEARIGRKNKITRRWARRGTALGAA
jgi:thiol-disulfide isomerase/thioredoxin